MKSSNSACTLNAIVVVHPSANNTYKGGTAAEIAHTYKYPFQPTVIAPYMINTITRTF